MSDTLIDEVAQKILAGTAVRGIFTPGMVAVDRDAIRDAFNLDLSESIHREAASKQWAAWKPYHGRETPVAPTDWQIGYKVFFSSRGKDHPRADVLQPATSLSLQSIRYEPGHLTIQPHWEAGPFAVFADRDDAEKWGYGTHVYQVLYLPSQETQLWKKLPPDFVKGSYGGYYAVASGTTERSIEKCPANTVLAQAVWPMRDLHRQRQVVAAKEIRKVVRQVPKQPLPSTPRGARRTMPSPEPESPAKAQKQR